MTEENFKTLVREMREKQKLYFATRNTNVLKESKKLEQRVDKALSMNPEVEQQKMFG